jgi:predicted RNA-binding protein with PUA-like domain
MQPKDLVLFYHTGKERQVVGIAEILTFPYPDPASSDPKYVVVDLQPVRPLPQPVTLVQIKQDRYFTGWELIRLPRLSVVPVLPEYWQRILQLAGR